MLYRITNYPASDFTHMEYYPLADSKYPEKNQAMKDFMA